MSELSVRSQKEQEAEENALEWYRGHPLLNRRLTYHYERQVRASARGGGGGGGGWGGGVETLRIRTHLRDVCRAARR